MFAYLVRRVISMVILLFFLSLAVFFLFNLAPRDPAALTCGKSCTPQVIEANRHRLGYDDPIHIQYAKWVSGIFFGRVYSPDSPEPIVCDAPCLGYSFLKHEKVTDLIVRATPPTFFLAVGSFALWMILGVGSGIIAALNRGRWPDRILVSVSLVGYSLPSFFIGLVLIFFVIIRFKWLPYPQWTSPTDDPVKFLQTMILPWFVLAFLSAAFYTRLTRNQLLETMNEDFVRTARAKGLPERTVITRHALRAGLTPIVTAAGLDLAILLGGAVIAESLFGLPGLGSLAITSISTSDLPVITGITLVTAALVIIANLVVDLLYAVIDPRVRIG